MNTSANGGGLGRRSCILALLVLTLASCAYLPPSLRPAPTPDASEARLVALSTDECRSVLGDDAPLSSLQQAVARNLEYLEKLPSDRTVAALDRRVSVAELTAVSQGVSTSAADLCARFRLYRAALPQGLLVTGYYQPELPARRARSDRFRYPLYRVPDDLVEVDLSQVCPSCSRRVILGRAQDGKLVPYYSRAEIDGGALVGRGYEIAWLDDPVEVFFLHVQGSALLRFEDGVQMQVSYDGSNGLPYTSIGRVLIEQGKLPRDAVSLSTLKDYLRAHPAEQAQLMTVNQRYIFFRPVVTGPVGSLGVVLTEGRSIAADATIYPRGGVVFLRILPRAVPPGTNAAPTFARLVAIQDAGSAITGPGRIDVFFGTGATAAAIAGDLRNPGELYLLLPQ